MSPVLTYIVVVGAVLLLGTVVAVVRKGRVATTSIGTVRTELRTPEPPRTAFERISAIHGKYSVDDADPGSNVVVLGSGLFMHPVFIHADDAGSRIEVGCRTKFFVTGKILRASHDRCVRTIRAALTSIA